MEWTTGYDDIYGYSDRHTATLPEFLDGALHAEVIGFGHEPVLAEAMAFAREARRHFRTAYAADRAMAAWFAAIPRVEPVERDPAPIPDWYDEPYEAELGSHHVRIRGHIQRSEVLVDGTRLPAGKAFGLAHTEAMLAFVAGNVFVWTPDGTRPDWLDTLPEVQGGWLIWSGLATRDEQVWLRMWNRMPQGSATRAATPSTAWFALDATRGLIGLADR
ncbi:MAG: hypothetical protein EP329_15895 [Deltaproteobacteria bacterium]|nr:MAG: hypothetical protein EP329_15895 [Deltaproteobacteria bacterium]